MPSPKGGGGHEAAEIIALVGLAAAWPVMAPAQQRPMPVIGILNMQTENSEVTRQAAYRRGLEDAGFVDGRNVTIENRFADGENDRLPILAAELVRRPVTVLMANTTPPAIAAKAATATIPIVFLTGVDPVKFGLVASLNRPGLTSPGSLSGQPVVSKRLELLCDVVPKHCRSACWLMATTSTPNLTLRKLWRGGSAQGYAARRKGHRSERHPHRSRDPCSELRRCSLRQTRTSAFDQADSCAGGIPCRQAFLHLATCHRRGVDGYGPDQIDSYRQAGVLTE